jgi:hypothetical protein
MWNMPRGALLVCIKYALTKVMLLDEKLRQAVSYTYPDKLNQRFRLGEPSGKGRKVA